MIDKAMNKRMNMKHDYEHDHGNEHEYAQIDFIEILIYIYNI